MSQNLKNLSAPFCNRLTAVILLLLSIDLSATKYTVDQDGGSSYSTISDAINAAKAAGGNDTIYIQGSDIDTYKETFPTNITDTKFTFISDKTNPDSFPVIKFSGWNNWWQNSGDTTKFIKVIIDSCNTINLSNNGRFCYIDKCVIRNFTNNIFTLRDNSVNYLVISNTIFFQNTGTIFPAISNHNVSGPYGNIINCTFYGNSIVDADAVTSNQANANKVIIFTNCIFKKNTTILSNPDNIKQKCTFNLIPSTETGWTNCIANDSVRFANSNPTKPSDFNILFTSPARNAGTSSGAPAYDLAGISRDIYPDIGAYENFNNKPTDILLDTSEVYENFPVGTKVGIVKAVDPDTIRGDVFTYGLVSGTGSTDNGSFSISGNVLKTNAVFNYENQKSYSIRVRTTDQAGNADTEIFTISVKDTNEAPTDISISKNTVPENSTSGTLVGKFASIDPDTDTDFTYSFVSGSSDNKYFKISGDSLFTDSVFNFEGKKNSFIINVRSKDQGDSSTTKIITILVTNVNESPYAIHLLKDSIPENNATKAFVAKLTTDDPDAVNTFTYTLLAGLDATSFSISNDSLYTAAIFNYEGKNTYTIRIQSKDQGDLSDTSQFTIKVSNVSEAPTKISLSSNTINENMPVGTTIGTLSSDDEDVGDTFIYSLSGTDASSFTVTGSTLKSNSVFNYEMKKSYSIIIRSTDKGGSFKDSIFNISIIDGNDISAGITLSKDSVPDNTKGIIIGVLKAVDEDTLETFTYSLVGGTDNIYFSISGNQLKADSLMDYQFKHVYNIKVRAVGSLASSPIDTVFKAFSIRVFGPPEISYYSDDTIVQEGKKAVFTVIASGPPPLTYKWYKVGNLTSIDTSATHTFSSSRFSDSGKYYCEVSNPYGSIIRDTAKLTVVPAPALITLQPIFATIKDFDTVSFSVTASGTVPIKYLWLKNGTDSVGNSSTLKFQVHYTDSGSNYRCIVTNVAGKDTSDSVSLAVKAIGPKITKMPSDTNCIEGDTAVFTVQAKGTVPLTYKWYKNNDTSVTLCSKDTLLLRGIKNIDSGYYYCKVSNVTDSSVTIYAKLSVGPRAPGIAIEPTETLTVVEGDTANFFTKATGSRILLYSWFKKDRTDTIGRGDALKIAAVTENDSGQYYCIVQNSVGSDTTRYARLIVLTAPRIEQIKISKTLFYVGDTAKIEIIASSNPSPKYQWHKNGIAVSGDTGAVFTIYNLNLSNNTDSFYCSLYNTVDTVTSNIVKITVEPRPDAGFTALSASGKIPLTVTFTDTSIGTIDSRIWNFGDGTKDTITKEKTISYSYPDSGYYNVKLIVIGPGGRDSVTVVGCVFAYMPGANPVQISASYIKGMSIKIQLSNFQDIDTIKVPPPYVDSIGVWGTAGKLPQNASVKLLKVYSKSEIFKNASTLTDTLNLPAGSDSVGGIYGLMTGLFWNDKRISDFIAPNGCTVLLRDTLPPSNPLRISGMYSSGTDSVLFTITNIENIDTSKADSVIVWYGQDTAKYWFDNDTKNTFSVQKIISKASLQKFTFYVQNRLFLDSAKIWCSVAVVGKNHLYSNKYFSQFSVGNPSPDNPVVLNAQAISPSKIRLTWNKLTNISHLRIWKGLQPIPLEKDISLSKFDTLKVSINDTTILLTGLNPQTSYYFGAQVQVIKNGPWSKVTERASAGITTPQPSDTTKIPNTIVLDNPVFDTLAGKIRLHWCQDTSVAEDMIVGITYSNDMYPDLALETFNVQVKDQCIDTVLELKENLLFDTTYYIALWIRKADGVWSSPTDKSRKLIRTPEYTRQVISFFNQNSQDTVKAFNNTINLWKDQNYNYPSSEDTVVAYKPDTLPDGFIQIGSGFEFSNKEPTPAFYIGMRYNSNSIPSGLSDGAIRIYRDSSGSILLEHGAVVDSVNKIVYVRTAELDFPFLLMVDTLRPTVDFTSNTNSIAFKDSDIKDTLIIDDNIANVKYKLVYGKGDTDYIKSDSGVLNDHKKTIYITIPAASNQINQDCGVRALLITSDGIHLDTFNISRQVMREKSDEVTTISDRWYPLSVTAELTNDNPESVLVRINNLVRKTNNESKSDTVYDMRYARLFRWIPTAENSDNEDKWVEYTGSNSSLFRFISGRMFWIKTLNNVLFDFGSGITTSLKDTFKIKLPPKNWTDFALPYHFSIRISDILSSTKKADSLHIYSWLKDNDSKEFSTKDILIPGRADKQNLNVDLSNNNGFTVYNPYNDTIKLCIPPIPSSLSKKTAAKKANNSLWGVIMVCRTGDGTLLPDVYCGFSKDAPASFLPAAPSFMKTRVMLINRENGHNYGHFITGNISKEGFSREIVYINNSKDPAHFTFLLSKTGSLPGGFSPSILDPVTQSWQNTGEIIVAPRSTETRLLAIGTDNFHSDLKMKIFSFKYALLSVYPNPCLSFAKIKFTVPYNSKEQLDFSLFNTAGKKIWENRVTNPLCAGEHFIVWDGRNNSHNQAGTGLYILRVAVRDHDGRIQKRFTSKLTYLH